MFILFDILIFFNQNFFVIIFQSSVKEYNNVKWTPWVNKKIIVIIVFYIESRNQLIYSNIMLARVKENKSSFIVIFLRHFCPRGGGKMQ